MKPYFYIFLFFVYSIASAQEDTLLVQSVEVGPVADSVMVPVYLCLSQSYCYAHLRFGWDLAESKIIPVGISPGSAKGWTFAVDTIDIDHHEISIIGENPDSDLKGRINIFYMKFALLQPVTGIINITQARQERLGYCDGDGGIEPIFIPGGIICTGFLPGDANGSGAVNGEDVLYLTRFIFHGGPAPASLAGGDTDGDCRINALDVAYLIKYFKSRRPGPILRECQ
jgi:hypothetical protein